VRASIAIPGIFTPVWRDGVWLVDGGLSNPVPVSVARAMRADCVIAVDLNNDILNDRNFGAPARRFARRELQAGQLRAMLKKVNASGWHAVYIE
jgi:predicted acylesterase/phospholipase RssA